MFHSMTEKFDGGNNTNMSNKEQKVTIQLLQKWTQWLGALERWCAVTRRPSSMLCRMSLFCCLHSGYHCYRNAKDLNTKSKARLWKTRSIAIILHLVFHKIRVIARNTNQKRRLLFPIWFACGSRNSPRYRQICYRTDSHCISISRFCFIRIEVMAYSVFLPLLRVN